MLTVSGELVHPGVGITVSNENFPVLVQGDASRQVEGVSTVSYLLPAVGAEIGVVGAGVRAVALFTDGHKQLAVSGELHYLAVVALHQPHIVILVQDNSVGKGEHSAAPGRQIVAVPVKDDDGMVRVTVEAVDSVLRLAVHRRRWHIPTSG